MKINWLEIKSACRSQRGSTHNSSGGTIAEKAIKMSPLHDHFTPPPLLWYQISALEPDAPKPSLRVVQVFFLELWLGGTFHLVKRGCCLSGVE